MTARQSSHRETGYLEDLARPGLPAEEITGKDDIALFTPEEARVLVAVDREVILARGSREFG